MTPLLNTRHLWHLRFAEIPLPPVLPRDYDIVRVGMGLGLAAIDTLIDEGQPVGPLLCCIEHHKLLVPVRAGTAHWWGAPHSDCEDGPAQPCQTHGPWSACRRMWAVPPGPRQTATTEPGALHHHLSQVRARMRNVSGRPQGARVREVCHV